MGPWSTGLRFGRLIFEFRAFLRERYSVADCQRIVRERIKTRRQRFLSLAKAAIFANPASPYLPLFDDAQCTYDDLTAHVMKDGLEATLETLRRAGVYVTFEQFKYGKPLERGGRTFHFSASDFDNPLATNYLLRSTGGTRSGGTPVRVNLQWIADRSVYEAIRAEVYDTWDAVQIGWLPAFPALSGISGLLEGAKAGKISD